MQWTCDILVYPLLDRITHELRRERRGEDDR